MGGNVVNFTNKSSKLYTSLFLTLLVVSGLSFNGRPFLHSVGRLKHGRQITSLLSISSGDLNAMTVKDLKDLLRAKGLSVTGLKKELIERLTESKSTTGHDYLATPKSNILKRPLNLLTRKAKITLDENVSILVDGTDDDVRIIKSKTISNKAVGGNASGTMNSAVSSGFKKAAVNKSSNSNSNSNSDSGSNRVSNSVEESSSSYLSSNKKSSPEKPRVTTMKSTAYSIDDDDFLDQIMNDGDSAVSQSPSSFNKGESQLYTTL